MPATVHARTHCKCHQIEPRGEKKMYGRQFDDKDILVSKVRCDVMCCPPSMLINSRLQRLYVMCLHMQLL